MKKKIIGILVSVLFFGGSVVSGISGNWSDTLNLDSNWEEFYKSNDVPNSNLYDGYTHIFEEPGWHNITFPEDIWLYNSSIASNDTCENFCQQGGIEGDIDWIFHYDPDQGWTTWLYNRPHNTLTHLTYNEEYRFHMLNTSILYFVYDLNGNQPPSAPTIDGPTSGKPNIEYTFTFNSTDPDGDAVMYIVDWGDGDVTWTEYGDSGEEVTLKHTWTSQGTFTIKAQAIDIYGAESDWAEFVVSMPKNNIVNSPFLNWLQSHPNMFPILQKIILHLGL
jgi:hypothetical protein